LAVSKKDVTFTGMKKKTAFFIALFTGTVLVATSCASPMEAGSTPGYNSPQLQGPSGPDKKSAPTAPNEEDDKKGGGRTLVFS